MGALTGEPFDKRVKKQIEKRQEVLSTTSDIPINTVKAFQAKSVWCRLASSVNVTDAGDGSVYDKLKSIMTDEVLKNYIKGDNLAKNFILQGGSTWGTGSSDFKVSGQENYGLNYDNALFGGSYGWGGVNEKGYVPQPGITNANTTYYNNGALSKTTINIRCYSQTQLNLIDILYLRPGYTVLFEFGHSMFLGSDSGKLYQTNAAGSDPLKFLFNPKRDGTKYGTFLMQEKINAWRKRNDQNYEAVFGKIIKYAWTFNPDGSYDITTTITGMGTVIESLKLNVVGGDGGDKSDEDDLSGGVITKKNQSKLNNIMYDIQKFMKKKDKWDKTIREQACCVGGVKSSYNYVRGNPKGEDMEINHSMFIASATRKNDRSDHGYACFMSLGALCAYLEGKISAYTKIGSRRYPLIAFDINTNTDYSNPYKDNRLDYDDNYFLTIPGQFSANPLVALLPQRDIADCGIKNLNFDGGFPDYKKIWLIMDDQGMTQDFYEDTFRGRIMKIPVCFDHIIACMDSAEKDTDGAIAVIDFLRLVMDGIGECFGGINDFRVILNEENGLIQIKDEVPHPLATFNEDKYTKIQAYGVQEDKAGSFVKNIALSAELSDDFAAMVAIGAQASGNQNMANATSFSTYNKGLIDRVLPNKLDYPTALEDDDVTSKKEQLENLWNDKIFKDNYGGGGDWINWSTYNQLYDIPGATGCTKGMGWTKEVIDAAITQGGEYVSLLQGVLTEELNILPPPFFIPFNLQLTLDGISGIKLFQKFYISDNVLPPSYLRGGVDLIVKAVNHTITTSTWETTLETISVPSITIKPLDEEQILINKGKSDAQKNNSSSSSTSTSSGCGTVSDAGMPTFPITGTSDKAYDTSTQSAFYKKISAAVFDIIFKHAPPKSGWCARWCYNFAYGFKKAINDEDLTDLAKGKFPEFAAGGNANMSVKFWNNMTALGYKQTQVGKSIDKPTLNGYLKNDDNWAYGDICVYYCVDGPKEDSHVKYGHVQFFMGDAHSECSSGWTTSTKNNYGTYNCYKSRTGDCWDFYVFRAPRTAKFSNMQQIDTIVNY